MKFEATISDAHARRYDAIPVGETVVYTVHDPRGNVIYVGITEKTPKRAALDRFQEHLYKKDGEFIGDAAEFRLVGHYDAREAHALEQDLIDGIELKAPGSLYNRDLTPWTTYADRFDHSRMNAGGRPRMSQRGVDHDMRPPAESRRRPIPEYDRAPAPNMLVSFKLDFE